jgi:ribosome modulation factor
MPDTKTIIVSATSTAWQEGYRAGRRGRIAGDNPYDGDTKQSRAWLMGLLDGRTKQLTVVPTGGTHYTR